MVKKLLSFLLGVALSSSWWCLTVIPRQKDGTEILIPVFVTIITCIIIVYNCIIHWEDK